MTGEIIFVACFFGLIGTFMLRASCTKPTRVYISNE